MRAHIIVNGIIANTVVVNSLGDLPGLIDADVHGGSVGDLWDGVSITSPIPNLAALKTAKNEEINAARLSATFSTFAHSGKVFSCDQLSRSDIDGINGFVALNNALPPGWPGAWKASDNSYLPIADVSAWKAFYASMVATGNANFAHSQTLKTALASATDVEQVAAIKW